MKRLRTLLLAVIVGTILSIPAAPLPAAPPRTTVYTTTAIQLRDGPKPTARVIATLSADVRVRVNSCAEGWCSITTQGLTGYVLEQFLVRRTARPPAAPRH